MHKRVPAINIGQQLWGDSLQERAEVVFQFQVSSSKCQIPRLSIGQNHCRICYVANYYNPNLQSDGTVSSTNSEEGSCDQHMPTTVGRQFTGTRRSRLSVPSFKFQMSNSEAKYR